MIYLNFPVLTLLLPAPPWTGDNTVLPSNNNISKKVRVNAVFSEMFFKEYLISFLMVSRLVDITLVVLKLLMFNVGGIIGI